MRSREVLNRARNEEHEASFKAMGSAIIALRESRRMSRTDLAGKARVAVSTLRVIERGGSDAKWGTLRRIASALGVTLDVMIEMADELLPGAKGGASSVGQPGVTFQHGESEQGDTDTELSSAICIYLIAECRAGATIGEIAHLQLGGRSVVEEVTRVSAAVSKLAEQGEVRLENDVVVLV